MLTRLLVGALFLLGGAGEALAQAVVVSPEIGQVELTLAASSLDAVVGRLELELALGDRLRVRAEVPVSARLTSDLEVGLDYDFSREGRPTLVAGIDIPADDPSALSLRFESEMVRRGGEFRSEVTVGVGHEREVALEVAGGREGSNFRGTLHLGHDAGGSGLWIEPGAAWKVQGVWFEVGVPLPSAGASKPSLTFSASFDF